MKQYWKQIPGFPSYFVSVDGRVLSLKGNEPIILKSQTRTKGYKFVDLRDFGKKKKIDIHRLVLMAFVGMPPKGKECDHINRVRDDNRLENLRWVTKIQNEVNKLSRIKPKKYLSNEKYITIDNSRKKKYKLRMTINGKYTTIGCYYTLNEAIKVRDTTIKNNYEIFSI